MRLALELGLVLVVALTTVENECTSEQTCKHARVQCVVYLCQLRARALGIYSSFACLSDDTRDPLFDAARPACLPLRCRHGCAQI